MSFLFYQGEEPELPDPPPRVYARLDHGAPAAEGGPSPFAGEEVVLLDSVGADWYDEVHRDRPGPLADPETVDEADRNVSVLELRRDDLNDALGNPSRLEGSWIELELGYGGGPLVLHYLNLFAAPVERALVGASRVADPLDRELAEKTRMDDVSDASADQLTGVLAALEEPSAAAVYDVGQGNCNAALDTQAPRLYFDLGGGVLGNRNTFPPALTQFCFTHDPPIVLSHWDWDHWSSANRDTNAYHQTWIVPRQGQYGLGAVHRTFLGRLLQNGTVLVWPSGLPSLQSGAYELLECAGPTRNNSGLALVLERTGDGETQRMLFPGDCTYDHVPHATTRQFSTLVASHHGDRTGAKLMPQSDRNPAGRLVYSYGRGNSYGHPFAVVRNDHTNAGWHPALETPSRCPPRTPGATQLLGHVHLYWDASDPDANLGCGGANCQLTCHQR